MTKPNLIETDTLSRAEGFGTATNRIFQFGGCNNYCFLIENSRCSLHLLFSM